MSGRWLLSTPHCRDFFLIVTRNLEREGWDLEGQERKKRREMGEKRKKERRREETPVSAEAERSSSWGQLDSQIARGMQVRWRPER